VPETVSAADREATRRWLDNWRSVGRAQDALLDASPPPEPADCLARGFSLVDFARALAPTTIEPHVADNAGAVSIHETWIRLRAAYGR
jgi:hypothetical protein